MAKKKPDSSKLKNPVIIFNLEETGTFELNPKTLSLSILVNKEH